MKEHVVLYWTEEQAMDPSTDNPLAFTCQAEDTAHAEEQCENAYPDCTVVWVGMGMTVDETYQDYWDNAVDG